MSDAWTGAARTVVTFVRSQNRLPEPGPYSREAILHEWLRGQRRAAQKGRLSATRMTLLDHNMPGWRLSREDRWNAQLASLVLSMQTGAPLDPNLKNWLLNQRRALAEGNLKSERQAALSRDIPGWQEDSDHQWRSRAEDLADFVDLNHMTPPYEAGDSERAVLYRWMNYQRFLTRAGKLPTKRLDWLNKNVPDWLPADSGRDGAWSAMADKVADFFAANGRWPVTSQDGERQMARWLGTQRSAARREKLGACRAAWLNAKLAGWNNPDRRRVNGAPG